MVEEGVRFESRASGGLGSGNGDAQSLLESFAENLGGASTLPTVFLLASSSWRGWWVMGRLVRLLS